MSHSASADHTTAVLHHEPRWEPPRRGLGIAGLCLSGCGLAIFIYYFSTHANNPQVTGQAIGWAALAVALTPSGLIVGRWGFGSQRAADTRRAFVEDIVAMYDRLEDQGEKVDGLIALTAQAVQHGAGGDEPAEQLARIEKTMLDMLAGITMLRDVADRLAAAERGMDAMARAVRETAEQQSREASRLEVRLDALTKLITERLAAQSERLEELEAEVATLKHAQRKSDAEAEGLADGSVTKLRRNGS